jgi:hypothetical protein
MLLFSFCVAETPALLALPTLQLAEIAVTDAPIARESNKTK